MTSERSSKHRAGMVLGVLLAAFGVGMLIDRTDLVDMPGVNRLWPVVLIAVGITHFMGPQADIRHGAGLIATGLWLLLVTLTRLEFRDTWPMLMVIFGLTTIWRASAANRVTARAGITSRTAASTPSVCIPATSSSWATSATRV